MTARLWECGRSRAARIAAASGLLGLVLLLAADRPARAQRPRPDRDDRARMQPADDDWDIVDADRGSQARRSGPPARERDFDGPRRDRGPEGRPLPPPPPRDRDGE
jgi:hypothetical protein